MHLFYKRALCFFCFLFLLVSVLAAFWSADTVFWLLFASMMLGAALILFLNIEKKYVNKIIYLLLCVVFVFLALANTYFRINEKERRANSYVGDHSVSMLVVSEEYSSGYSSEYIVKIKSIDGEEVDIKAVLLCAFRSYAKPFDMIYADLKLEPYGGDDRTDVNKSEGILLSAVIGEDNNALYQKAEGSFVDKTLSRGVDGIWIAVSEIGDMVARHVSNTFIGDAGGLAAGLLMNDKSEISPDIIRDFRRTGTSHLLAVSGMHVSLLLGFIDLLMRKLFVHKNVRCVIIALLAVVLLALAGFSMSACRSVFMLFVLYLNYMFMEENDSVTSLFFSAFIIILLMPFSVYDLGLWMSFFATLGLVSVFPVFHKFISAYFYASLPRNFVFKVLLAIIEAAAITTISNVFLLPIMWYFFGELSLVSLPVNIIVTPIVSLLMPLIVVGSCIFFVPIFGSAVAFVVEGLSKALLGIIGYFSRMDMATVSLRYYFATYIMAVFISVMIILIVVKLEKKWMVMIPAVLAAATFTACLLIYNGMHPTEMLYYSSDKDNAFVTVEAGRASVVDVSKGSIGSYIDVWKEAQDKGAVMIDELLVTHVHSSHVSSLEYVMSRNIVKTLYLPVPKTMESYNICEKLYGIALECGTETVFYNESETVWLEESIAVSVSGIDSEAPHSLNVCFSYDGKLLTYTDHSKANPDDPKRIYIGGSHITEGKKYSVVAAEGGRYSINERVPLRIHKIIK